MDGLRVARREVLGTAGAVAIAALGGRGRASGISGAGDALRIDVHCHDYNVRDVPSYAFTVDVAIQDPVLRVIAAPLAFLIVSMVSAFAPDYAAERKALAARGPGGAAARPPQLAADPRALFIAGFERVLAVRTSLAPPPVPGATAESIDALLDRLGDLYPQARLTATAGGAPDAARLADAIVANRSSNEMSAKIYQFLFVWAPLMAHYRDEIADDLLARLDPATPLRLVTPAILDITGWLASASVDGPVTTVEQQVELAATIALLQPPGCASHAFVAFDPWRQVETAATPGGPTAFDIVRRAVEQRGAIGVKLYPPMGFRATCNAAIPDSDFPPAMVARMPGLGARFDAALEELYDWAEREGVPIMTHCAATQGPSPAATCRASPEYWAEVLRRHPHLRLNFGHFGGLWSFGANSAGSCQTADWTTPIAALMATYDHVYADVGDVSNVLGRAWDNAAPMLAALAKLVAARPVVARRIMYGSDWQLLDREPGNDGYLAAMQAAMTPILTPAGMDGFMGGNAARFLGLTPAGRTLGRLRRFYAAAGRSSSTIDRIAAHAAAGGA